MCMCVFVYPGGMDVEYTVSVRWMKSTSLKDGYEDA